MEHVLMDVKVSSTLVTIAMQQTAQMYNRIEYRVWNKQLLLVYILLSINSSSCSLKYNWPLFIKMRISV